MAKDVLVSVLKAAARHPDRVAVSCHDGTLTYRELVSAAVEVAHRLIAVAANPERVGIVGADDRLTYAALLGIWLTGAAYTPLNKVNPTRRNREIIADARLDAVLATEEFEPARSAADAVQCPWLLLPTAVLDADHPAPADLPPRIHDPERLAYILFTSGTTGRPKGVPIAHSRLQAFVSAWLQDSPCEMNADDRFLQMFELGFDLSVMCIFVPWMLGASVHVVPHKGIGYLNVYKTLAGGRITVALMVPSVLAYLSRFFDEISLPELRYSLFCGEALPQDLTVRWSSCVPNATIQNTYGPTEATIFCYSYLWQEKVSAAESVNGIVPIGHPIPGMGGVVLDESGREVAGEALGELCLLGPQVASGYWENPDRTAAAFFAYESDAGQQICYRTRDLVSCLPNGVMVWRGRTDHQVKIDGHRVELAEIEAHARELSDSSAVAAVAQSTDDGHYRLVLFLEGGSTEPGNLVVEMAQRLPEYMRPAEVRRLDTFPLNANGKIDRNRLMDYLSLARGLGAERSEPG